MEEAERLSQRELMEWNAYEQVFGSLLVHERIDAGFAQVSAILAQAFGKPGARVKMRDFMPEWYRDLTADQESHEVWAKLAAMAKGNGHADH